MDVTSVTVVVRYYIVYVSGSDLLKNRNPELKKYAYAPAFFFFLTKKSLLGDFFFCFHDHTKNFETLAAVLRRQPKTLQYGNVLPPPDRPVHPLHQHICHYRSRMRPVQFPVMSTDDRSPSRQAVI